MVYDRVAIRFDPRISHLCQPGRIRIAQHLYRGTALAPRARRSGVFMIIAIDRPAASGKGTLGKRLPAHYGYRHPATGGLYRAVAQALLCAGADLTDAMIAASAALALAPETSAQPP